MLSLMTENEKSPVKSRNVNTNAITISLENSEANSRQACKQIPRMSNTVYDFKFL